VFYCEKCDAYFVKEIGFDYKNDNVVKHYVDHQIYIKNKYNNLFSYIEQFIPPSRFLDIGSGMGYSLEVAKDRGWRAYGVEPNVILAQNCISRGLSVQNSNFSYENGTCFGLIVIDNVLEHVRNPVEFVHDASRCLEKGGMLVIAVPPVDWLRKIVSSVALVRKKVTIPQLRSPRK
jgi:2-polyprenyl-3-methyl-5-hydroxy-6-metoxy-1,4-benzoquinol methylase